MKSIHLVKSNCLFFLIFFFLLILAPSAFAQGYQIAPVADWIKPVTPVVDNSLAEKNNSNGVAYLLVDQQWHISDQQPRVYRHYVSEALNSSGVVEISQIEIDFDPSYETLLLHKINVYRGNKVIDKLDHSQLSVLQREKELEYQIYDGSKTLNIFIEDVRAGDRVEYSYTLAGGNPIFNGHFAEQLDLAWGVPVGRIYYRVLWPSKRKLFISNYETDIAYETAELGQETEYVWRKDNAEEVIRDEDTPGWYDPYPVIYLSDMGSWQEVVQWARPLYTPGLQTPLQQQLISSVLENTNTQEQQVLELLRFVQEEVRYLGIEIGEGSHRPSEPDEVLSRRFGDCKDKSRLLASLLKSVGVEANLALVNSYNGLWAERGLPTPLAFNHVIVQARVKGKIYWLDPTLTNQNGLLKHLYQPDYDYALVVTGRNSDKVRMTEDVAAVHSKLVEESFDISNSVDTLASYEVRSHYDRYYADSMREELSKTSSKQLQQSYLNYTASYYPGVSIEDELEILEDEEGNRLTVTERYKIADIWNNNEGGSYLYASFEPFLINEYVQDVSAPIRTMPLAVTHPVKFQHITRIKVPEDSTFEEEFIEIADKAFRFSKRVSFSNDLLEIDYIYESLNDHVAAEDIQLYSKHINQAQELAYYQIQMPNPEINLGEYSYRSGDTNWLLVVFFLLAIAITILLSLKYIYFYDPTYQAKTELNLKLRGLGGWLILVGIGIVITPLSLLVESQELWYVFSAQQWSILSDQYGGGLLTVIAIEMMVNAALLVVAVFLIVMFFQRRHTFPRIYIIYSIASLVIFGADMLALNMVSIALESSDITELVGQVIGVTIWCLYFLKSERVKATFTCQRQKLKAGNHSEVQVTG